MRILFYTSTPRSFQTTLIGYLYEICQVYSVVLLAEELPQDVLKFLHTKELFPKLEKIVPVEQYTGKPRNLLAKNQYLYTMAKKLVQEYKPNMIITANDVYPFEMYLMRLAKNANAVNVCMQAAFEMPDKQEEVSFSVLQNAHSQYPPVLPLPLRFFLVRLKKVAGHFLYYWVLPLLVGQKPFFGKASLIIWNASLTPQTSDYRTVFSKRDYDTYIKYGFPPKNVFILAHPLKGKARAMFQQLYVQSQPAGLQNSKRSLTIMWPDETISFRRSNYSLIPQEELVQTRMEIVRIIGEALKGWKIFIKPHPAMKHDMDTFQELLYKVKSISPAIEVTKPEDLAETYIGKSDGVVGFPPASTTLFVASLWHPEKPILSLDFQHELLGNFYEDVDGVEYIDTEEKLLAMLKSIRDNRYQKKSKEKIGAAGKEFSNAAEAVEALCTKDRKAELEEAISCARKAGEAILELYKNPTGQISKKNDGSPVTDADLKAGEIITRGLRKFGYAILSEEMPKPEIPKTEPFWVVDPLDGTEDFLSGTGDFAVQVGLVQNGEVQLGVVYVPLQKKLYFGEKGKGSYLQTEGSSPKKLSGTLHTNGEHLRFVASRNHTSPQEKTFMESFAGSSIEYRGSAGVKLGLIAEQKADCYINLSYRVHLWDICAPEIILREAGGMVRDGAGNSVQYSYEVSLQLSKVIAARSPQIHETIMEKIYAT